MANFIGDGTLKAVSSSVNTVIRKNADFAIHSKLSPNTVHHVVLAIPDRPAQAGVTVTIVVTHRGGTDDPIWFDFTSAGGLAPMTTALVPEAPNAAVLLPNQMIRIDPKHWVDQVSLTSGGVARYSVWAMW